MRDSRLNRSFLWVENLENAAFAQYLARIYFENENLTFVETGGRS
jgi:hypothetical protein